MRAPLVHRRLTFAALAVAAGTTLVGAGAQFGAGQQGARPPVGVGQIPSTLPLANTIRERGTSVTPAFEGWYNDRDGTVRLLVGYYNRNTKQQFDIPPGPSNDIEPGGPDQGQPTHFLPGRQWGVFTIKVPSDFAGKRLTWTLVTNGFTNTITLHTRAEWIVEPYEDAAQRNTPPVLKFQPDGASFTGPPTVIAAKYTAVVGEPLAITMWVTDQGPTRNIEPPATDRAAAAARTPPLALSWSVFRGPGPVSFDPEKPPIDAGGGRTTTKATFAAPGDYVLRVESTDSSGVGGGGFQCCWTNAHVAVAVKPASTVR